MQELGRGFRRLEGQRRVGVALQVLAFALEPLRRIAHAGTRGDDEQRHMIAGRQHVVGEA